MSAVSPHSTHWAFAFKGTNVAGGTEPLYWSCLAFSRQRVPYRITAVRETLLEGFPDQKYEAITAMPEFLNNSFEVRETSRLAAPYMTD